MTQQLTPSELVYQINTHLLYEIKWLLFAATEFKRCDESKDDPHYQALIDSSFMHARNLFEFISMKKKGDRFTLFALGGTSKQRKDWDRICNNRVAHMYHREMDKASWPDGLDNVKNDRFTAMSKIILDLLESQGSTISDDDIRKAFDVLVTAAKTYLNNPSSESFSALESLYDASQDGPAY